ncbi:MAG: EamA family transporter [Nitrospirae bacterium]|nr:EamA family transporter [Nitrospirota bacterium]
MDSLWILLSIACAFTVATSDALTKKALEGNDLYLIAWLRLFFTFPVVLLAQLFVPLPQIDAVFFKTLLIALPIEVIAFLLYMKALQISPLSLTLPFLALTPIFLIVVPTLILGENVSVHGALGIILIASGSYTLNVKDFKKGLFEPIKAIKKERGAVYMIIVALIYSITAALAKKVVEHSSAIFSALAYNAALLISLTPYVFFRCRLQLNCYSAKRNEIKATILPGVFDGISLITGMMALGIANVAYMVSIKRFSLLIGVLYGYLLFKESGIKERLLGSALMLAGFVIIVIFH